MSSNLLIPLSIPRGRGFFSTGRDENPTIQGHRIRVISDDPFFYLVIEAVETHEAEGLIILISKLIHWASIKIGFSLRIEGSTLRPDIQEGFIVDGGTPTLFVGNPQIKPTRISASMTTQEGDVLLTRALQQATNLPPMKNGMNSEFAIGCELFSAVDFESTANAQFIVLTSILEIMSKPALRAPECVKLLDDLIRQASELSRSASGDVREAFESLEQSALNWKKESFRGAIRSMAKRVAAVFGDTDSTQSGKNAVRLYDKRSGIVHRGESASHQELAELRQLVREMLAAEAGCIEGIRG